MWDKGGNQVIWGDGRAWNGEEFCSFLLFYACMNAAWLCTHRRSLAVLLRTAFFVSRRGFKLLRRNLRALKVPLGRSSSFDGAVRDAQDIL